MQCQGRPPDGGAFAFPGAESGKPLGRVCAPPPEPHPPSGLWRPRESGHLFPRKGVQDPHQLLNAPGAAEPSSRSGSPARSPPIGSWRTAGVRYVSRPAGHASPARRGDSGARGPSGDERCHAHQQPQGHGHPQLPEPEGGGRRTPPGAVSPRLRCRVTEREGGGAAARGVRDAGRQPPPQAVGLRARCLVSQLVGSFQGPQQEAGDLGATLLSGTRALGWPAGGQRWEKPHRHQSRV